MSTQNTAMLDIDPAYELVNHEVYAPVFFTKLATDYGIRPKNPQEAQQMLSMASQLRDSFEQEEKQAAAAGNPMLNLAHQHLNSVLASRGHAVTGLNESVIEKAAADKATEPALAHAILSLLARREG